MFTTHEIVDLAIQIEKNGESVYREAQNHVSDPLLASLFKWLADEESKHAQWFSNFKDQVKKAPIDAEMEAMGKAILRDVLGDQTFSLKQVDMSLLDKSASILRKAVEFEKDTILFYDMIGSFIEDEETLEHLERIKEEENRHIQALNDLLGGDVKPYGESTL